MSDTDRYAEPRKQYPNLSESYWELTAEKADAERRLRELARLVGYHERDGAVPVEKIQALVPGLADGAVFVRDNS